MLTTTRREIINDYDISQNRQLRNFAPEYNYTREQEPTRDFQAEKPQNYSRHYMSRSEMAQRLYGEDYRDGYESVENNAENYSNPDLMPSMQTMQATQSAYYRPLSRTQDKETAGAKQKLSTRSKILIASYAAVLLALALIITLTTVSIASLFADASALELKLNSEMETVAMLDESIAQAEDPAIIAEKASQMGMTNQSVSQKFDLPTTKVAQNSGVNTNGFDNLCDAVSSIFGG